MIYIMIIINCLAQLVIARSAELVNPFLAMSDGIHLLHKKLVSQMAICVGFEAKRPGIRGNGHRDGGKSFIYMVMPLARLNAEIH